VSSTSYFIMKGKAKYVQSKLDGNVYCKTNGKFTTHLLKNNIDEVEYVATYIILKGSLCPVCNLNYRRLDKSTWEWYGCCGKKDCIRKHISKTKLESFKDEEFRQAFYSKLIKTVSNYTPEHREAINERIRQAQAPGLEATKNKRRETCEQLYGDPTYSNREAIKAIKALVSIEEQTLINNKRYKTNEKLYGSFNTLYNTTSKFERDIIQCLFDFGTTGHTYLSETGQFYIGSQTGYWLYDFANHEHKKIIEFNGDFWHANPNKFKADDYIGRGVTRCLASEKWLRDEAKLKAAHDRGYQTLVIWEADYYANPETTIENTLIWLQQS
jgi:G:T-mismatch repair DNA endonuclease (very short patch repair protein)